jgi:HdeA/HdeB family
MSPAPLSVCLLAAAPVAAQVKCWDFIGFPRETIGALTIWLDGYLTDEEEPCVVDFTKMKVTADRLGLYCAQHRKMSVLNAAEDIMEK